jgi:phosphoglycolate phosphatase
VKKLILWDIDGTLLRTGRAGLVALVQAFHQLHGREPDMSRVDVAGRTDKWITARMLEHNGLPVTTQHIHDLIDVYLTRLPHEIATRPGLVLPGIQALLDTCRARPDIAQGLLTGNVERGARIKLEHYRVWHYFEFGAFGDDSALRNELGPHALRRAAARHACAFPPAATFVIGDTPHDIECGKVIGAKTIGVATGSFTVEQLQAHAPTAVFQDFTDAAAFLRVIDGV